MNNIDQHSSSAYLYVSTAIEHIQYTSALLLLCVGIHIMHWTMTTGRRHVLTVFIV